MSPPSAETPTTPNVAELPLSTLSLVQRIDLELDGRWVSVVFETALHPPDEFRDAAVLNGWVERSRVVGCRVLERPDELLVVFPEPVPLDGLPRAGTRFIRSRDPEVLANWQRILPKLIGLAQQAG